ncbi:MAG: acyltransferase family protein [Methylococcus sp.]|nr:acyltransferase family protein [Methylococcus sp.]
MSTALPSLHSSYSGYRSDIDGLRAIAVLAVVIHHAFPLEFKSGYTGVDIFFVISGFLISSIIINSLERDSFSILEFYIRRVRRIFPALIVVMSTCYALGWFVLFSSEFSALGKHIAAGAAFVSNLVFWSEAGYFDKAADSKPLLHLWSLGIEEQFYIFWPLLLWAAYRTRFGFIYPTVLILSASFALSLYGVASKDDTALFFSPLTRSWELMLGGVLAWLIRNQANYPYIQAWLNRCQNINALLGFLAISAGLILLKGHHAYPGYRALLPVLGAFFLIAAGPAAWINKYFLSIRPVVWIGILSYPLYLWHWPLLSFSSIIQGEQPVGGVRGLAILISLLLAAATYRLVEKPMRFGSEYKYAKFFVLTGVMVAVGMTGYATFYNAGLGFRSANAGDNVSADQPADYSAKPGKVNFCSEILPQISHDQVVCQSLSELPDFMIVGDSHAGSFAAASRQMGLNALSISSPGCLPFTHYVTRFPVAMPGAMDCNFLARTALVAAQSLNSINTVVLVTRGPLYFSGRDFNRHADSRSGLEMYDAKSNQRLKGVDAEDAFVNGYSDIISQFIDMNKRVVFLTEWPELNFNPVSCVTRQIKPFQPRLNCEMDRAVVDSRQAIYHSLIDRIRAKNPRLSVYDSRSSFCVRNKCYAGFDGSIYYSDDNHLSAKGSERLLADFLRWLRADMNNAPGQAMAPVD